MTDFSNVRILVIGDAMLDKYFYGSVKRISPEAPVPVVKVEKTTLALGGAANVVNNVHGLKASSYLIGISGKDRDRDTLVSLLKETGARVSLVPTSLPTITKTRVISDHQQIVRLDFEELSMPDDDTLEQLKAAFREALKECDVVVLSDYGKGVCGGELCGFVISEAKQRGKAVLVDPKGSDWSKYRGAYIITPNVKELSLAAGRELKNEDNEIETEGREILTRLGLQYLLVTRSSKGMSLISSDSVLHVPTKAKEVFDVSGAGDTVISVTAAALGAGLPVQQAVELANKGAGIVVSKLGTAPILYSELFRDEDTEHKIVDAADISHIVRTYKQLNKKVVFTNGCFDVLHIGHLRYLKEAANLGDILIVGLNSDGSVRRLKGNGRPVNTQERRAEFLANLPYVDCIVYFEEDTPGELIKSIGPDILVKGGDYKPEEIVGGEYADEVVTIPFVPGFSTTETLSKLTGTVEVS